ncbi:unnamed protein product, partial [Didymodactylos carnosus]
ACEFDDGEQKKPEVLKKQPFGVIPVLEDDDYLIYESRGICRYLDQKYKDQGSALAPNVTDVKAFGKFEQAASVEIFNYDTCASGIRPTFERRHLSAPTFERLTSERPTLERPDS